MKTLLLPKLLYCHPDQLFMPYAQILLAPGAVVGAEADGVAEVIDGQTGDDGIFPQGTAGVDDDIDIVRDGSVPADFGGING